MNKFLHFYAKKLGQRTVLKGLLFFAVIILIIILFSLGTRKQLKLLERSANTELWYTANSNISTYLQFSDLNSCKYCRNATKMCKTSDGRNVVYFVTSYISNTKRRHAIRGTWGAAETGIRPIFVMGISSQESEMIAAINEAHEYKDIIIENFVDTFENTTLKTASALKHFNRFCEKTKYLMKTEDDMFVNTDVVESIVRSYKSGERRKEDLPIIGFIIKEAGVVRNVRSLWYVGHSMYPERRYPDYAARTGYIVPGHSVNQILTKSMHIPMIPIEDAFFTGIVAFHAGLCHEMDMRFNWKPLKVNNHCIIRTRAIILEPDPFKMYNLWRTLKDNHQRKCFNWYNSLMVKLFA